MTIVDLASDMNLPVGVVRVLLGDLSAHGLLQILPARREAVTNTRLLRDVLDGLRAL
jgi:DNA-binding GntR family transcriptional regulator